MGRAGGVSPGAVGVHGKSAVSASGGGLRHHMRLARVGVGDGQRAAGVEGCGAVGLGHELGVRADGGRIVAAGDGDLDRAAGRAVLAHDRESVADDLTGGQLVMGRAGGVSPGAVGVHGKSAVSASGGGLRHHMRLARVGVGDGQRAAGVEGCGAVAFGQRGVAGRDRGGVIGAVNIHRNGMASRAVKRGHSQAVMSQCTLGQSLYRCQAVVERVGPSAIRGDGEVAIGADQAGHWHGL